MPYLVRKTNIDENGNCRVEARTYFLPMFMAMNANLARHIELGLRKQYKGREVQEGEDIEREMSKTVIDLILDLYPYSGMREMLESLESLDLEARLEPTQTLRELHQGSGTLQVSPREILLGDSPEASS